MATTVQELSRDALGRVDALVDAIVPVLVGLEPPGFYDEESTADLRRACRDGVTGLLRLLAGDTSGADPLAVPREAGRRQVQQDFPLEGVLRAYRAAGKVLWEDLVAHAGTRSAAALLAGASQVWEAIDSFSSAAAEAYRHEESVLRQRDDRVQSSVLAALLDGQGADPQFARDAQRALGLTGPWVCVVALAQEPPAVALEAPHDRLAAVGIRSVWVSTATGEVGVVSSAAPAKVQRALRPCVRWRAGMSPVTTALADLPRARRLAEVAAAAGRVGHVALLEEDLVAAVTADSPLVAELVWERTVGVLLATAGDDGPELLDTVRAFLAADGSLNTAAAASFVHRNTMQYRLKKIEKLSQVSLRALDGQVLWALGLRVDRARRQAPSG